MKFFVCMTVASVLCLGGQTFAAATGTEPTACGVVTAAEAVRFVGGPLDVKEFAKIAGDSPASYDSVCTYIAKGKDPENATTASRLLDLTLHFANSTDEMKKAYDASAKQYQQLANAPNAAFKNTAITPLSGFGDSALAVEAVTDPKGGYKSALIVFYKGKVGGSISAWKKPESSLETTKAVLRHILSKLP